MPSKAAQVLKNIAGKYKIIRFELGSADELWNLICHQIDMKFQEWGINYSIAADTKPDMYKDKLMRMMAMFESTFPDKGLMIVIDEMLSYLKGRSGTDKLNRDLAVIQALGEMSDHSKFRMVFGVQELIYTAAEFQFAAKMLNQVSQRYRQIEITKQDVQFVTEQRILKKQMPRSKPSENIFPSLLSSLLTCMPIWKVMWTYSLSTHPSLRTSSRSRLARVSAKS